MADPRVKQLKIKTNVVKRIAKEKGYYEKETEKEVQRLEKFRSEGADEHVLNKQKEVIEESRQMGPESKRRLMTARDDLKNFMDAEKDLGETEEYKEAEKQMIESEAALA